MPGIPQKAVHPDLRPQGKESPDSCLLMHSGVLPLEPGSPPECLHLIPVARFKLICSCCFLREKGLSFPSARRCLAAVASSAILQVTHKEIARLRRRKWRRGCSRERGVTPRGLSLNSPGKGTLQLKAHVLPWDADTHLHPPYLHMAVSGIYASLGHLCPSAPALQLLQGPHLRACVSAESTHTAGHLGGVPNTSLL